MKKFLRVLFNIFWIALVGLWSAIEYFFAGIASCITIIPIFFGIPKVYFRAMKLVFAPAGKQVKLHFGKAPVRNVFWLILGGWFQVIAVYVYAAILCVFIVTIPLALQLFKFGKFMIAPFGASVIINGVDRNPDFEKKKK